MSFASSQEAHRAHWFSRRHETADAHNAAREVYRNRAESRPKQTFNEVTKTWER